MKSLSRRVVCVLVPLLLIIACLNTSCIFSNINSASEPIYRFQENLDEFFSSLDADPDIYESFFFIKNNPELYGEVNINIRVNSEAWDHIDEIISDRIMPKINDIEFLLALDEHVYYYENRHVRLRSLDISFYTTGDPDSEGLSQDVRITYGSGRNTGFKIWYKHSEVEWPEKPEGILLSRDPYENEKIYDIAKLDNEKDLNLYFISKYPSVDWFCMYILSNPKIEDDDFFETNIQLHDNQTSYEEVERLFMDLLSGDNGELLFKTRKTEQKKHYYSMTIKTMRVVFMVDGSTEYVVFEAIKEDNFEQWTVTKSLADPSMEGTVISKP